MNRWKIAFFGLLVAAVCGLGCAALMLADRAATLDTLRDSYERRQKALTVLRGLTPEISAMQHRATRDEIAAILSKQNPGIPIASGGSTLEIDELRFHFDANGALDRIEQTDDYGTRAMDTPGHRDTNAN
jgi:hypothetical protein